MTPLAIHQFSTSCSPGDGISNGILFTQKLLQKAGIQSEIFTEILPVEFASKVHHYSEYRPNKNQVLLIHHGIGNGLEQWLEQLPDRRFMVFHNITPASFFSKDHPIQPGLTLGWEQLKRWQQWLDGAFADSRTNLEILLEYGYCQQKSAAIPLLVDLEKFNRFEPGFKSHQALFRLIFVGRIIPHKNQLALINSIAALRQMTNAAVELYIVGGIADLEYAEYLKNQISLLGLTECVKLTGKVSEATLEEYMRSSDLYVSLSQHEGFGMPLIEAMHYRLPVLACHAPGSNVRHTLNGAGILLEDDNPLHCAGAIKQLMESPKLRHYFIAQGQKALEAYEHPRLYQQLWSFFAQHEIQMPAIPQEVFTYRKAPVNYCLEGPFDSSYSLAIVNRELARALERRQPGEVSLRSSEGLENTIPNPDFLQAQPDIAKLHSRAEEPFVNLLRLMYPPRTTLMKGRQNSLGCFGWEESELPIEYIEGFNQNLDLITTMSSYVTKTLIDNGIRCPVITTGIGTDHLLRITPDDSGLPTLTKDFRFLHISSCFPRKGIETLLHAYGNAYSAEDNVTLVIKTFPNPHYDIETGLEEWARNLSNPPHVTLINQDYRDGQIRALYGNCQVLLAPSRGEGFGLPLAEAMLHGLPVITTGFGGQTDFCNEKTAWLIDYYFSRAKTHMGQLASVWVDGNPDELAEHMTYLHNSYNDGNWTPVIQEKLRTARRLLKNTHTWDSVAARVENALRMEAQKPPMVPPRGAIGIVTTWNRKCGIATYSRLLTTPAMSDIKVFAPYDMAADDNLGRVIRCWTDDTHDPLSRLENAVSDTGVGQLLIQFNFSFFGTQALNRLMLSLIRKGLQVLITFHSTADVYWGEQLKSLLDMQDALRKCTRIFVHSISDLNRLKDWGIIDNVTLLPHGVDWSPTTSLKNNSITSLENGCTIASYGFLLPHKGVRPLIEAFQLIIRQYPHSRLLLLNAEYPVAGSRKEVEDCRKLIEELGLEKSIELCTEYLDDEAVRLRLSAADCIVFPYQHTQESSSAAVRCGLAAERPVLCTPLNIFEDVENAIYTLPGVSPSEIAQGILDFLQTPSIQESLAQRQRQWLEQHAWQRLSYRLRNIFQSLAINPETRCEHGGLT